MHRTNGEGTPDRHHGQNDEQTRQENSTLVNTRSMHRKSRKAMEKRRAQNERNRKRITTQAT
jgi:hypothetical protein